MCSSVVVAVCVVCALRSSLLPSHKCPPPTPPSAAGGRAKINTVNTEHDRLQPAAAAAAVGDPTAYHYIIIRNGRRVPTKVRTVFAYVYNNHRRLCPVVIVVHMTTSRFLQGLFTNSVGYPV